VESVFPNRVAGVIRIDDADLAFEACMAAYHGGIATLEVTLAVPDCFDVVRRLTAEAGVPTGVGTVWDPNAAREAKTAGASFVVTPVVLPEVASACRELGLLCVLGALTPTEIYEARLAGAGLVKVFPVAATGGPNYVRWLAGPMPGVPLWVSGGVEIAEVPEYIALGVKAVGLTTALFPPEALATRDLRTVWQRARRVTDLVQALQPA
jgi:2-dehydro-3-deoxyphosphogluconate aldolase/(4S)-4-hydroxy-2-oxoglutarate aldolase